MGVLQTARLEVEFGREDYTIVQVQSQRVAELYFLTKKKVRCLPLTSGISRLKSQWREERRCPEVACSYPGLISAGIPPSGRSRHLAESSESDSEAGKAAVQRTMKISGTVSSRLSEKKILYVLLKTTVGSLLNQGSQAPRPWTGYWSVTC